MAMLLHPENIDRLYFAGRKMRNHLVRRLDTIRSETAGAKDPDVSVVIRTKNDMADLPGLIEDIRAQEYGGKIEIILVDTSSTDGTAEYAVSQSIRVISIAQKDFTYPRSLNIGFEAASYDYAVTLVGHSSLSNTLMFKCLTRWHGETNFGGLFCFPLPSHKATRSERLGSALYMSHRMFAPKIIHEVAPGMLCANASIVSRAAWKQLGGYDERYAGGGEDTALGRNMLEAGMTVVYEPAFTVFHSHGLGLIDGMRQTSHWREVALAKPQAFDAEKILNRRPDLRQKDRP